MYMNMPFLVAGKIGATELIVILLIVLILFGPKQLPQLSKMFGKTIKSFKEGMQDDDEAEKEVKKVEADAASSDKAD